MCFLIEGDATPLHLLGAVIQLIREVLVEVVVDKLLLLGELYIVLRVRWRVLKERRRLQGRRYSAAMACAPQRCGLAIPLIDDHSLIIILIRLFS